MEKRAAEDTIPQNLQGEAFEHSFDGQIPIIRPLPELMKTDISESDSCRCFDIELPGIYKEDITISLNKGYLHVQADTNYHTDAEHTMLQKERVHGTMGRNYFVGDTVTEEDVKARFEHGVLRIVVKKKENFCKDETTSIPIG